MINYEGRNLLKLGMSEMQKLRGKEISVIFQEPMTSLNPVFTVGDQIAEVLRLHMNMSKTQAWARAEELLKPEDVAKVPSMVKIGKLYRDLGRCV